MKCFFHRSDLDGHCSGAIIKIKYPECEMIGVDYDDTLESLGLVGHFQTGEKIFIVDFSFGGSDMDYLNSHFDLHWIDHHKSAIEKYASLGNIKGIREIGKAGCELTWEYLHPDQSIPDAAYYLGRYDVWDHENGNTLPFQYGMRNISDTQPGSEIWNQLLQLQDHVLFLKILNEGKVILTYQRKQDEIHAKEMTFEVTFEGLRAIALNKIFCDSKVFDSVYDPEKHDIMILFGMKGRFWKYSLYSTKPEVNVSKLAVKYSGGGNAGAAGFYSKRYVL